ncbi:tagaturonate reductase [Paenibacillus kobensis]|uniref:tagaturonate reductase n=1 Tax=Paenibacillus kobensis TaxID=59841 RepID=UPI000FD7BC6D|nr:tagaturonate reductase [Paenibacillus kobensis]
MEQLKRSKLQGDELAQFELTANAPVTVLQIGEGNFLRGFADWMIHACRVQGLFGGSVAVTQPRPSGKAKIEKLAEQDGLYTLIMQGLVNGEPYKRHEKIQCISQVFDPYTEWSKLGELAVSPSLTFVISNTTEAGLVYTPEPLTGGPILSFPGKMAFLLHERYQAFGGDPGKGLIILPCELLERNGDALREAVLRYAADWRYSESFCEWVRRSNRFLNSLVDRIVTGYPDAAAAEAYFTEWGYRDELLCTAEPYHLWAIEAEPEMEAVLPLRQAGLNVHWTDDLRPFQQRKVRLLNGAHTWMAPIGLLNGVEHVGDLLRHPALGEMVKKLIIDDIVPILPYDTQQLMMYAGDVFDRFGNPHIRHRLADIAMNSISKFKVRLLPTIKDYLAAGGDVPLRLSLGMAGLLRYYRIHREEESGIWVGQTIDGKSYSVRDDEAMLNRFSRHWETAQHNRLSAELTVRLMLQDEQLWGEDLTVYEGFVKLTADQLEWLERGGANGRLG